MVGCAVLMLQLHPQYHNCNRSAYVSQLPASAYILWKSGYVGMYVKLSTNVLQLMLILEVFFYTFVNRKCALLEIQRSQLSVCWSVCRSVCRSACLSVCLWRVLMFISMTYELVHNVYYKRLVEYFWGQIHFTSLYCFTMRIKCLVSQQVRQGCRNTLREVLTLQAINSLLWTWHDLQTAPQSRLQQEERKRQSLRQA